MDIEAIESPDDIHQRINKIAKAGGDRFETKHKRKDGEIINVEPLMNQIPEKVIVTETAEKLATPVKKTIDDAGKRQFERIKEKTPAEADEPYENTKPDNTDNVTDTVNEENATEDEDITKTDEPELEDLPDDTSDEEGTIDDEVGTGTETIDEPDTSNTQDSDPNQVNPGTGQSATGNDVTKKIGQ